MKLHLPGGKTITLNGKKWLALEFESREEKESIMAALDTPSNLIGLFSDGITDKGAQRLLDKVEAGKCERSGSKACKR